MKKEFFREQIGRDTFVMLFLIFLSLLVRLISLHFFHFISVEGGSDSVVYALTGKNIFSGKGLTYFDNPQLHYPPFFPFLIGLLWFLIGNLELSGQLVSVLAGSLLVLPCYYMAKELYGKKVGLLSGFLIAFNPWLVKFSTEAFSEALYTFLLFSSIALGWIVLKRKNAIFTFLTGAVIALCYLTRPEGILVAVVFGIVLLFSKFYNPDFTKKVTLLRVFLFAGGFLLLSFPYFNFIHQQTGKWGISGKAVDFSIESQRLASGVPKEKAYWKNVQDSDESNVKGMVQGGILEEIKSKPENLIIRIGKNFENMFRKIIRVGGIIPTIFVFVFIGIAFLGTNWDRERIKRELYIIGMVAPSLVILLFWISFGRYLHPILPLLIIWIAKGIIKSQEWISGKERFSIPFNQNFRYIVAWAIPIVIVLGSVFASARTIYNKPKSTPFEYKIMGQWMKENIEEVENKIVMARKGGVPFYAGCKWSFLFYGEYPQLIVYLRKENIDYLLMDEWKAAKVRPQFAFLLDESKPPPELEVVHLIHYKGRKTILYQLKK